MPSMLGWESPKNSDKSGFIYVYTHIYIYIEITVYIINTANLPRCMLHHVLAWLGDRCFHSKLASLIEVQSVILKHLV